jgi:hypothetical protein
MVEMDCLGYRRRLLEDPAQHSPELDEHEAGCPACAQFARRTRADEARLRAALNVPAPEGLAERIELAASFQKRPRSRSRRLLAAAAGIAVLAIALPAAWFLSPLERRGLDLAQSVLQHVRDEVHHMREVGPVPEWQLDALFGAYGARLTGALGPVNFAARCLMRKKTGIHLVMPGERGPITVFFMPAETVAKMQPVADERFAGYVEPTGWGSIAVIGEAGEPLEGMAGKLMEKVEWPVQYGDANRTPLKLPQA